MEHHYKDHIIVISAAGPGHKFKWKPNCIILAKGCRTVIKQLEWDLDYESPQEAEQIGLYVAKKWIDA
ncbi:MAG: hypothetical protein GEU78_17530 [Actinobacteria bacterium]|nr:hypothetical protein [Actinomycetota bacterium]